MISMGSSYGMLVKLLSSLEFDIPSYFCCIEKCSMDRKGSHTGLEDMRGQVNGVDIHNSY